MADDNQVFINPEQFTDVFKCHRSINFDLSVDLLKKYYPKQSVSNAYYEINRELAKLGFYHRQGSGYVSDKPITRIKLDRCITKLCKSLPWIGSCVKKLDVTNVSFAGYDYKPMITNNRNCRQYAKSIDRITMLDDFYKEK